MPCYSSQVVRVRSHCLALPPRRNVCLIRPLFSEDTELLDDLLLQHERRQAHREGARVDARAEEQPEDSAGALCIPLEAIDGRMLL